MSIDRVTVLGAGTMGHGIAINAATAGYEVVLFDIDDEAASALRKNTTNGAPTSGPTASRK